MSLLSLRSCDQGFSATAAVLAWNLESLPDSTLTPHCNNTAAVHCQEAVGHILRVCCTSLPASTSGWPAHTHTVRALVVLQIHEPVQTSQKPQ